MIKNIIVIAVAITALSGCARYSAGPWGYTPKIQKVDYDGEKYTASIYRAPDSTKSDIHVVGVIQPKPGVSEMPKVTGSLTDLQGGGKQLDVWVKK
jgi:hypothetical protein